MTEADEAQPKSANAAAAETTQVPAEVPLLDANGRERPHFLLSFPDDAELQKLVRAFEAGNYRAVRQLAPELIRTSEDITVRAAARELMRRIEPDPLTKYLLGVALLLFVFVVWYTYQGQH